jgi:transposase
MADSETDLGRHLVRGTADDDTIRVPRPPAFDKEAYRRRSAVEQAVGRREECRSVGTRSDKLAVNFLAMVKLARIRLILRRLHRPSDRT